MQVVYEKYYGINHKITLILTRFYWFYWSSTSELRED
jgi:hypothetical protein